MGGDLIREARKRAGLTQAELAERAGTTQSAVARWERGASAPSFDNVRRLVRLCGFHLGVRIQAWESVFGDDHEQSLGLRRLSVDDRYQGHDQMARFAEELSEAGKRARSGREVPNWMPERVLEILSKHQVEFVMIGGYAAVFHGADIVTRDVDITPDRTRDNLARLSAALKEMHARVYSSEVGEAGLPFDHDADSLAASRVWNLTTPFGRFDISFEPAGTQGFPDLKGDAVKTTIRGVPVLVASLRDIVRSKEAANRVKDQVALPVLRELLADDGD